MPKPTILVVCPPDHYSLRNLDSLRDRAEIYVGNDQDYVNSHGAKADVLLYSGLSAGNASFSHVWQQSPNIKWVHSLSAGVEKYMVPPFIESPVPLTNARGVFKRSLAEFAVLAVLYFSKRVRRLVESQRAHHWDDFSVEWLPGKVMAIVGYGEIGRECGLLAKALGLKIYATRRNPQRSSNDANLDRVFAPGDLHQMLAAADVVVASAPLTPETHHLLDESAFAAMKPSAIVVNVGRGPLIKETALISALQEGKIAGAALDVFEKEPLPSTSPLWDMDNVLISPHCTDRTKNPDWLDLSMKVFLENFDRYSKGEPLQNIVDKKAGY